MLDDLKLAWRRLRRSPGFTAVAVVTLTLSVGVNTAIFSIADAVLFRPLPYRDPDRVSVLQMMNRQTSNRFTLVRYPYLQAIEQNHRGLGEVGMWGYGPDLIFDSNDGTRRIPALAVTTNYFQILGVRPARGRLFDFRDSTQAGRPALLSYEAWQQRFGGDEKIVGGPVTFSSMTYDRVGAENRAGKPAQYQIKIGSMTFDIVGVLPAGFVFPFPSPMAGRPEVVTVMAPVNYSADGGAFHPIVRLEPGVTRAQAQAELETLIKPLTAEDPKAANIIPVLDDVRDVLYPVGRPIMSYLLAAAVFVLLIGCANLAIMLLARSKRNEHEIGVRAALGAPRTRLVRPLFFEAALISVAGALLAVLVTVLTFNSLLRQVPKIAYGYAPVGIDLRVTGFTIGLSLLAGLAFSIVPAWRSSRVGIQGLIQGRPQHGGMRRGRLGRPMIAIQVALALALVFGAVIAGRAFISVLRLPLGFAPEKIMTVDISPGGMTGIERQAFYLRIIDKLAERGEVVSVGAAGSIPLDGVAPNDIVPAAGTSNMAAGIIHILPGYFESAGIQLLRGRSLNRDDIRDGTASVISESTARRLFPGRDPLGATFTNSRGRQFIVVGVVAETRRSLVSESEPPAYVIPGEEARRLTLIVRTRTRQERVLAEVRREISAFAPGAPLEAKWWTDSIRTLTVYSNPRFQTLVLGSFAGLALVLTALGIFGIVAFSVAMRTHEMGVRMALGATSRSLIKLIVKQTIAPVVAGLLLGFLVILWASAIAEAQLYKVETRDPATLVVTALTVIAVALLAAYGPARRASRVDPLVVLRAE